VAQIEHPLFKHAWIVSRHEDVVQLFKDARSSSDGRNASVQINPLDSRWMPKAVRAFQHSMVRVDDPAHGRLRGLVHLAFTPRRIEQLKARVESLTNELLDRAAAKKEIDLMADFATPLPLTIISEMMGVPVPDRTAFRRAMHFMMSLPQSPAVTLAVGVPWTLWMMDFFRKLVRLRRDEPGEDLTSALCKAESEGDRLSEDELVAMLFLLLFAGHETTVNLIGSGTLALLEHRDQFDRLREKPELADKAVEELLRFAPPAEFVARFLLSDISLHGQVIPRGAMVLLLVASANRDEEAFDNAEELDIGRDPNRHLTFGLGKHFCLGAPLSRLEGKIALRALAERFPKMRLAVQPDKVRWRRTIGLRGLAALPIQLS
jgi:cytochrome P450